MRIFSGICQAKRAFGMRQRIATIAVLLGLLGGTSLGQIDVNETGLHDANEVYGIDGSAFPNPWANNESISLFARGETEPNLYASTFFYAYGIYSDPNITNAGAIDVNAVGGNASGGGTVRASITAYGLYANGDVNNTGAIQVAATGGNADGASTWAYSVKEIYGILGYRNVLNEGAISVFGTGGTAANSIGVPDASIRAYGISGQMDVDNRNTIAVDAEAGNASSGGTSSYAYAHATAYGINAYGQVDNSGAITTTATAGIASSLRTGSNLVGANTDAAAYGIYAYGDTRNSGVLNVAANGGDAGSQGSSTSSNAEACGIYSPSGDVVNTANIAVVATGGNADAYGGSAFAYARATGIQGYGDIDNSGGITTTAIGGTVDSPNGSADPQASGISVSGGAVNNSGDLTVTAAAESGSTSYAYGLYLYNNNSLTNTGTIRAFGDEAYELYVVSGTTTLVNTYNVTLDGDPSAASILVGNGATLALNNSTLLVTDVQDGAGATQWNTEYRLFQVAGEGAVSGNFSGVDAVNPNVTANYYTLGTANAADDTVALSYAPEASMPLAAAAVEKRMVAQAPYAINQHMTRELMYDLFSSEETGLESGEEEDQEGSADETALGRSACQRAGGAFLMPHYSYLSKDNDPLGYDARLAGVSGGYTQCVNSSLLGLHLGYGQSNIDYTGVGYSANTEDQRIVTSGFSGITRWKSWIARYGFGGFHGWHDYHGLTGLSLDEQETASYNSYGGTGLVMVGRTFRKKAHVFLPEIGASWLWVHRESYTTEATDASWDTTYSTLNDHDVWAEAALHWQSLYTYRKIKITPSASIGIHQLLSDDKAEVWQSVPGAAGVLVENQQDRTAVSLAAAVVLRTRHNALTLAYDGEYASDVEQHSFWARWRLRF